MRILFFMLAVFVVTVGISTGAKAENYPWCAYYSKGCTSCAFSTFEQCMADVSGIGGFVSKTTRISRPAPRSCSTSRAHTRVSNRPAPAALGSATPRRPVLAQCVKKGISGTEEGHVIISAFRAISGPLDK